MPPRRSAFKAKYSTAQGYADHFPFDQNQEMMETLKGLKRGDIVTIRFTTDFDRHRIESIRFENEKTAPGDRLFWESASV